MKMKLIPLIAALAAVALALTLVSSSQAGKSGIINTDHDLASPGAPTCEHCHLPHRAQSMFLWAMDPDPDYTGASVILPLCYSCHDGSVGDAYIPDADHNHPQDDSHGSPGSSCWKCHESDCGRCHDAHDDTWVFLDSERFDADTIYPPTDYDGDGTPEDFQNASMCAWCHSETATPSWHASFPAASVGTFTHPEMVSQSEGAADFTPPSGANMSWLDDTGDLDGTRLWTDDTVYTNHIGLDDTQQYVVVEGDPGDIRCMTCHTTHVGQDDDLQTMGYDVIPAVDAPETDLACENLIDDDADTVVNDGCPTNSAICINCHE
jgi:hypothetical protein